MNRLTFHWRIECGIPKQSLRFKSQDVANDLLHTLAILN